MKQNQWETEPLQEHMLPSWKSAVAHRRWNVGAAVALACVWWPYFGERPVCLDDAE